MPLTPNGKIDKPALPFPDTALLSRQKQQQQHQVLTQTERQVHELWCNVLGENGPLPLDEAFFDVGGHSVLATRLVFEIRRTFSVDVPLGLVFQEQTIRRMAAALDNAKNILADEAEPVANREVKQREEKEAFDYAGELAELVRQLPEKYEPGYNQPGTAIRKIFLTGATGFLGAFLVAKLLVMHPEARVYCLVRAEDEACARERLVKNLEAHSLAVDTSRLEAVPGDLQEPLFGLEERRFSELAAGLDFVVHNGAMVHWVYTYQKLKGPNVNGTMTALELAKRAGGRGVCFVSSTSVLDSEYYGKIGMQGEGKVKETDTLEGSRTGLSTGY
ncbi:MAG: male sterility protein-domain-containing protein, partial [Olpidium bornovanus]